MVSLQAYVLAALVALSAGFIPAFHSQETSSSLQSSAPPFLGRWDLTLQAPDRTYPSWLEIREENGGLTARMVGRWGNARPLPKVAVTGGELTFVSPKEEEGSQTDLAFHGKRVGKTLSGTLNGPDGKPWRWTGVGAPALAAAGTPRWGKPISLFDGKDLAGWTMDKPGPPVWTVHDGLLISPGHGPELITDAKFQNFKLHVEFNAAKDSNSGVYLRGRYEVQIETDSAAEPASHHTGAVYGFLTPHPELPRAPDTWQSFDITLVGRRVTVVHNRQTVIDDQEIPGITGGALNSYEAMPGPVYLQGSEQGHVSFRKIVITPAQ